MTRGRAPRPARRLVANTASVERHRARYLRGRRAEDAAARYLAEHGLVVLARNLRVGSVELDLVAQEGEVVAVIEVRTRGESSWGAALESIDARKQQRLRRAAQQLWATRFARVEGVARMRFDAVTVAFAPDGSALVEHIRAAF